MCVTARMCDVRVGRRHPDARVAEQAEHLCARDVEARGVDLDEVCLDAVDLDRNAFRVPALREPARPLMVEREQLDVVVERVEGGRGDHPCLPHGATEEELLAPGDFHQVGGPCEHGAERAAEALREAERDGVDSRCDRGRGHPESNGGVHQPGTVHVDADTRGSGDGDNGIELVEWPDAPARDVVRVLDDEHGRALVDDVLDGGRCRLHLGRRHPARDPR